MKRNSELKYRQKLINEYNMNKSDQKELDKYRKSKIILALYPTYKSIYLHLKNSKESTKLLGFPHVNKTRLVLKSNGILLHKANGEYKSVYDILEEISKKWNKEG